MLCTHSLGGVTASTRVPDVQNLEQTGTKIRGRHREGVSFTIEELHLSHLNQWQVPVSKALSDF